MSKTILCLLTFGLILGLSACSNNTPKKPKYKTIQTMNQQQKVETGTVVAVNTFQIQADANNNNVRPYGNIGVSASSGGHAGIYGSIDLATLGRLFKKTPEAKTAQEIIVKKSSGETVAITQLYNPNDNFKAGEAVKILVRNGETQVIH